MIVGGNKNQFSFSSVLLFLVGLLSATEMSAQTTTEQLNKIKSALPAVDAIMKQYAEKNHYPGFAYGIVVDGNLIHSSAIGYSNLEKQIKATPRSAFRVASMSKSFTAMAIVQLRDQGKLNLDEPVAKYIPELAKQQYLSPDAPPITIRHLLTHAAGFPEDNPWGDRQLAIGDSSFTRMIEDGISMSNSPGIAYEYSNLGFAMLGYIIQQVTGMNYGKYITEAILKPLGMNNTWYEYDEVPGEQLALGYRWLDHKWVLQPMLHDGIYGAMGGMISTIEDFSKYAAFHLKAWPPGKENNGPIRNSSIREMQHPWNIPSMNLQYRYPGGRPCPIMGTYAYGLGWTKDCQERVRIAHSGGLPGFGSQWCIFPDYGIGIVSFSNVTYANAGFVNIQVLDTLITIAGLKPRAVQPSDILKKRQKELNALLPDWKGATGSGIFAENFFLDYFPEKLRKEANEIFKSAGKISSITDIIAENNLRGHYLLKGEKADVKIYFTLSPEKNPLIQEYKIELISH